MSRLLTPETNLESLRKEAKRWLKALRAGDAVARARLLAILPDSLAEPTLREVHLAIAREHGSAGWAALAEAIADAELAQRSPAELVDEVLRFTWQSEFRPATRILRPFPQIARHSIHAAVACGDLAEVRRRLARDSGAATEQGGPMDWEPILYLAYSRLPGAETHAVLASVFRTYRRQGRDILEAVVELLRRGPGHVLEFDHTVVPVPAQ